MVNCLDQSETLQHHCSEWGIPYQSSEATLANASVDFGNIVQGKPKLVVQPQTSKDITHLFALANQQGFSITPRGGGRSQSGQSVSPDGITLDVSCLNDITCISSGQVRCGAATTWRQVVTQLGPKGKLPCVMPLNLDLTIGGTLSAGGFSTNSHRYGPAVANVEALELVTGAGNAIACSAQARSHIFAAALGGLGQCAVITSATLATRNIKPRVRTYYLLYEDLQQWLDDQQLLFTTGQADYVEGFCSASVQGLHRTPSGRHPLMHWLYGLHVSVEFHSHRSPRKTQILEGLHYNQLLYTEDDNTIDYAARYDARFKMMRSSGAWQQAHPWFECLLPLSTAREVIPRILKVLPPWFGDGHRVIFLSEQNIPSFFMMPSQLPAVVFALLPTGIPQTQLQPTLEILRTFHDWVTEAGGKRYLSGWLGMMNPRSWQQHYGDRYSELRAIKQQLDPNHVLRSVLLP